MANCADGPTLVQINLQVGDTPLRAQAATAGIDDLRPALIRLIDRSCGVGTVVPPALAGSAPPAIDHAGRGASHPPQTGRAKARNPVAGDCRYGRHGLRRAFVHRRRDGEDAVVYRAGPSGLRLARQHHVFPQDGHVVAPQPPPVPLIVNSRPTPVLTEAAAVDRAREHGLPFLFFTDQATGRGQLLYSRYDGNLGLITPTGDGVADGLA